MSEGSPIPHPEEIQKKEKKLRSSMQLAEAMGLSRNPFEKPTTYHRTFEKPLSQFDILLGDTATTVTGYETLQFEDRGLYTDEKKEEISTGVRIGEDPSTRWGTRISISSLLDDEKIKELVTNTDFSEFNRSEFRKGELKAGGYNKLLHLLEIAENAGFYTEQLNLVKENMIEEVTTYFNQVNQVLLPNVREHFPEYSDLDVDYLQLSDAVLYAPPDKGRKSRRSLKIKLAPDYIAVAFSKGRDYYTVHPPFHEMPEGKVHYGWLFEEGNNDERENSIQKALVAVKAAMS